MTKRQYQNYSRLFFFFSVVFSGFLIYTIIYETGLKQLIFSLTFGLLIFMQLRVSLLMRRKSQELKLK